MKLAGVFGHNSPARIYEALEDWPLPKCNIGLEWEFEQGATLRAKVASLRNNPYLSVHDDGSLRDNGVEIVTAGDGLYGKDLEAAIRLLKEAVDWCVARDAPPVCNYRTGFHVHIDVRDMEEAELHNFLLLYCLLEKPIFNFCGKDRWKSNFCVPWFRSDAQFTLLKQIELAGKFSKPVLDNIGARIKGLQRYSALNCQAIAKLGTLEFRHMENVIQEINTKQIDFIKIAMCLKKQAIAYAQEGKTGSALFNHLKELRKEQLVDEVGVPLRYYLEGWDYSESLMLAIGLVNFGKDTTLEFFDLFFEHYSGKHPNWS